LERRSKFVHRCGGGHQDGVSRTDPAPLVVGVPVELLEVPAALLNSARRSIVAWPSGTPIGSEDTLVFSTLTGVRPMNEVLPLERAAEGYELMMSGKAHFELFDRALRGVGLAGGSVSARELRLILIKIRPLKAVSGCHFRGFFGLPPKGQRCTFGPAAKSPQNRLQSSAQRLPGAAPG